MPMWMRRVRKGAAAARIFFSTKTKDFSLPGRSVGVLAEVGVGVPLEDGYQEIEFPNEPPIHLMMNMEALAYLKTRPKENCILEIDVQRMDEAIKDKQFDRPFFPYLLLIVEKNSRMILGVNLLTPLPSLEEMWGGLPAQVVETLAGSIVPKEVQTKNPMVALLLSLLEEELGIKVKLVSRLPGVEFAQRELRKFTGF